MIDYILITVGGGSGGNGVVHFNRAKYRPFGGPDGGNGGYGGSVYLVSSADYRDLSHLQCKGQYLAERGMGGAADNRVGRDGRSLAVLVPVGTTAEVSSGEEVELFDLIGDDRRVLLAKGGVWGRGNRSFATSRMQAPRLAEAGDPGEVRDVKLEYKTVADIALIGPPNSGKSLLLNAITNAGTRVADYPVTTVEPVVGVVEVEWQHYQIVEVPALWMLRAAADGGGRGRGMLKHAERAFVLVIVLDANAESVGDDYKTVEEKLKKYGYGLADKERVVLLNKIDLLTDSLAAVEEVSALGSQGTAIHQVSALTGEGLEQAVHDIVSRVTEASSRKAQAKPNGVALLRPKPRREKVSVVREDEIFVVRFPPLERLVAGTDLKDWEARSQLVGYIEKIGVHKALEQAGVKTGDTVRIGSTEMEWQ